MLFELEAQPANFIYKKSQPLSCSEARSGAGFFHLLKMAKIYFTISYQLHTGVAYYS